MTIVGQTKTMDSAESFLWLIDPYGTTWDIVKKKIRPVDMISLGRTCKRLSLIGYHTHIAHDRVQQNLLEHLRECMKTMQPNAAMKFAISPSEITAERMLSDMLSSNRMLAGSSVLQALLDEKWVHSDFDVYQSTTDFSTSPLLLRKTVIPSLSSPLPSSSSEPSAKKRKMDSNPNYGTRDSDPNPEIGNETGAINLFDCLTVKLYDSSVYSTEDETVFNDHIKSIFVSNIDPACYHKVDSIDTRLSSLEMPNWIKNTFDIRTCAVGFRLDRPLFVPYLEEVSHKKLVLRKDLILHPVFKDFDQKCCAGSMATPFLKPYKNHNPSCPISGTTWNEDYHLATKGCECVTIQITELHCFRDMVIHYRRCLPYRIRCRIEKYKYRGFVFSDICDTHSDIGTGTCTNTDKKTNKL